MSGEFPLSVSQRETLAMYTDPDSSDIFAVNGPPGTGKTTFLQTVIANRIVHAVLEHPDDQDIIMTILPGWKNIAGSIWNISIVSFRHLAGMKLHASVSFAGK